MKNLHDLVRGWLGKAESDLVTVELCVSSRKSFDVACFHAQQVIEKYLKAYLIYKDIDFPFVHDLGKLLELCVTTDAAFQGLFGVVEGMTEYAVKLRYDPEFWPAIERARTARDAALKVKEFVLARLPAEVGPASGGSNHRQKADEKHPGE